MSLRQVGALLGSIICFSIVVGLLLVAFALPRGPDSLSPTATFEAHSLALDEGRYADAEVLLGPGCRQSDPDVIRAAVQRFKQQLGLDGFSEVYPVTGVWLHDSGETAILELDAPPGHPSVQPLRKIDGEWRLQCA